MIPKITDPLGKHWEQPDSSNIAVDEESALMSLEDFNKLEEYSLTGYDMSITSGRYAGKMWKAHSIRTDEWFLKWYSDSDDPMYLNINTRKIIIV